MEECYFREKAVAEKISKCILLKHPHWSNEKLMRCICKVIKERYLNHGIDLSDEFLYWVIKDVAKENKLLFFDREYRIYEADMQTEFYGR